MNIPHPPSTQDTRRIKSMQPSLSVSPSLLSRDQDLEDHDKTGYDSGLQDSPVVPILKVSQPVKEVHVVPLSDTGEDDKKLSTSHHAYGEPDLWSLTGQNAATLADASPEPPSSPALPSVDDKVDPDAVVKIGHSTSTSMDVLVEGQEHDQTLSSSYLPDMSTSSPGSINGDGTESTDPPISIIASEDSEGPNDDREGRDGPESGTGEGGGEAQVPPSPAPSDVPDMPVFLPPRNSTLSLERHGSISSFMARKSSLFKSHNRSSSHDKRSSMPLPSAVIASLLPWRGSRRPSSEPELPSQSSRSRSRLSSSLPSPH